MGCFLGLLLLLIGLLFNQWFIEESIIPDEHFGLKIASAIATFQIVLVSIGAWFIWRKVRIGVSWLTGSVAIILVAVTVFALYQTIRQLLPPPWVSSALSMAERLEMIAQNATLYPQLVKIERYSTLLKIPGFKQSLSLRKEKGLGLILEGKTEEAIEQLELVQRIAERQENVSPSFKSSVRDLLAIAYLRMGEQENCIALNPDHPLRYAARCYLPILSSGVHTFTRGSRAAIKEFTAALNENPHDLNSRWLLNIAYMTLGEYPDEVPRQWLIPPKAFDSDYKIKRFYDVAPRLGLDVFGLAGGSIMEDFDGDGYLDIMVSSQGLRDPLRYFRNNGNGTFTERTKEAGLLGQVGGFNIIQADYNNDGYPDVLVLRGAWLEVQSARGNRPFSLLRNNGDGTFTDVTEKAGLLGFHRTQAAAWADYDNDGWVDLLVGNESWGKHKDPPQLFHNNGDGTFSERAASVGITAIGAIKGVAWGDYNNDGLMDLYISRFGEPNVLYRNDGKKNGKWRFTDVTKLVGVAEPLFSFATWFWDYDNDGWLDLFVAGFGGGDSFSLFDTGSSNRAVLDDVAALYLGLPISRAEYPRLYRNNRDGTFMDVTKVAKLDRVLHVMGANFGDIDNDGFLDLYIGTGAPSYRALMPNRMFRSAGGKFFQDVTTSAGVGHLQKGHGVSFGDIDNDGDQDIYHVVGGWFPGDRFQSVLFENPGFGNHWITLRLEGVRSNRAAIGARIKVTVKTKEGERNIYSTVGSGGSFGASSLQQEIGLGQATAIRSIEITWPATGKVQVYKEVPMDRIVKVREGAPNITPVDAKPFQLSPSAPSLKITR